MRRVFDPVHGGFGSQPKFPHPGRGHLPAAPLARPARRAHPRGSSTARSTAWRGGGIHDQLGGGFHRYSVDAEVDRAALREDVVRQLGAAEGLPRRLRGVRHRGVRRRRARDRALGARGGWPTPEGGLRRQPGRRRRARRRRRLLHLDPRRGGGGAHRRRARRRRRRTTTSARRARCTTIPAQERAVRRGAARRRVRPADRTRRGRGAPAARSRARQAARGARTRGRRRSWTAPATPTGTR